MRRRDGAELPGIVGLKRTRIYELEAAGQFPRRVKIGDSAVAWVGSEVEAWIQERIRESREEGCDAA